MAAMLKILLKASTPTATLVMEAPAPDNKALAQELGLAFDDLTPLERSMLLSAREAGVLGYEDGPESDGSVGIVGSAGTAASSAPPAPSRPSRRTNTDWCSCKHCEVLANFTESECLCCTELGEEAQALQFERCITEHPDFSIICLNMAVLRVAYFELRARGDHMDSGIHKYRVLLLYVGI